MDDALIKKLCRTINYNTYNNIQTGLIVSAFSSTLTSIISQNSDIAKSLVAYSIGATATGLGMYAIKGNLYTKDICQIKKSYQEFINDYLLLNEAFDLKDPIEISTMFYYLVCSGYLSKDKSFTSSTKDCKDIKDVFGAEIFKGNAVCRHIAAMLSDILNNDGIYSNLVGVYYDQNENIISNESRKKLLSSIKENFKNLHGREVTNADLNVIYLKLFQELSDMTDPDVKMVDPRSKKDQKNGNHAITFAFKDGKSYYLDATCGRVLRLSERYDDNLYDGAGKYLIKEESSKILNSNIKYNEIIDRLNANKYDFVSCEEEDEMVNKTNKICKENKDVFEQFYNNNKELYEDVSDKILKLKHTPLSFHY